MDMIDGYEQLTAFTSKNAGTSEWCKARKGDSVYFVKKFQSPTYPSADMGLSEQTYNNRIRRFAQVMKQRNDIYQALREHNTMDVLVVPEKLTIYQLHLCAVAPYVSGNVQPDQVCRLSAWQRIVLMRILTLAVLNVHAAGLVHGDLKPDNLIITQHCITGACSLKLIDFDACYPVKEPPAEADHIPGDMAYWAPEIIDKCYNRDVVLDQSTDIFALALTMHYLWAGKLPDTSREQSIGVCLASGGTITLDDSLPEALRRLMEGMLNKDPGKRFSCQDAYDVLGAQLNLFPAELTCLQGQEGEKLRKTNNPGTQTCAEIEVFCCDSKGNILCQTTLGISAGTTELVEAREIEGYSRVGVSKTLVRVNASGVPDVQTIRFIYRKKQEWSSVLIVVLTLLIALLFLRALDQKGENGDSSGRSVSVTEAYRADKPGDDGSFAAVVQA